MRETRKITVIMAKKASMFIILSWTIYAYAHFAGLNSLTYITSDGKTPTVYLKQPEEWKMHSGQSETRAFFLVNPTMSDVFIYELSTSCPCLTVEPRECWVKARSQSILRIQANFENERDYQGKIRAKIAGSIMETESGRTRNLNNNVDFYIEIDVSHMR